MRGESISTAVLAAAVVVARHRLGGAGTALLQALGRNPGAAERIADRLRALHPTASDLRWHRRCCRCRPRSAACSRRRFFSSCTPAASARRRGRLALQGRAVGFEQQPRRDAQDHALRIAQHQYPAVIGQARQRHLQQRLVAVQLAPQRRRRRRSLSGRSAVGVARWRCQHPQGQYGQHGQYRRRRCRRRQPGARPRPHSPAAHPFTHSGIMHRF